MQHQHDCDHCISLGEFKEFDLYFHPGPHWTLIARYGSDGDYSSGSHISGSESLTEARKRAAERKLITIDQTN